MRVLVIGGGGREHALAWALSRSPLVDEVHAAPGNPGIAASGTCHRIDASDPAAVAGMAEHLDAGLVVIGPEVPLVAGAADACRARGRLVFGPGAAGARLEGSKAWMKEVLADAGVPTARAAVFTAGEEGTALAYLRTLPGFYVVKTDGLAAGKGVVVTESLAEATTAVRDYLSGAAFGDAGRTLIIEEGLTGAELSLLVLCDGRPEGAVALAPAQDFKRLGDGDSGPNTGGMGAYSPVAAAGPELVDEVMAKAVAPTLDALSRRGVAYTGVLYAGLMLTPEGPKILEYNVRFGDPECQVVVPRLASDLAVHLAEASEGRLRTPVRWRDEAAVTVGLATAGYPAQPRLGDVIAGLDDAAKVEGVVVFHAGTGWSDGEDEVVTAGGRVLSVAALGATVAEARQRVYRAAGMISWPGMHHRTDIAAAVT
ncbi:MAG: phosphoribosylamine--glycine ligase [Acidimicrobiia bacterium]